MYDGLVSEPLGDALPDDVRESLRAADSGARVGEAILIATTDEAGRPHPAMLSYGEVRALDARTLRLFIYASSATASNLRVRGAVTLCLVAPGSAVYVKARAREIAPALSHPALARFEAHIEDVRRDRARADLEGGTEILSGITFAVADPGGKTSEWAALQEALT